MLKEKLNEIMEMKGLSSNRISSALGISSSALSQWMAGKYNGNITKIENAVKAYIERENEKLKTPKEKLEFVSTSVAKKVFEVAKICHLENELGIVYGAAGLGKTESVKEYARRNSDVLLVEADHGYTAKVLFQDLGRRLGLEVKGSIHEMFMECVNKLKGSGRMIIVDEAEHLPYKALELLRRVYDKAGIGIMLTGMPALVYNLRGKKGEYAQLYSRIGARAQLETLSLADVEDILKQNKKPAEMAKIFHEQAKGNTRILSKLIPRAFRIAKVNSKKELSHDIIKAAEQMLLI